MSTEQAAALSQQIAQLQIERTDVRARIAQEPDARNRQALYAQLHAVGRRLSPLERRASAYTAAR